MTCNYSKDFAMKQTGTPKKNKDSSDFRSYTTNSQISSVKNENGIVELNWSDGAIIQFDTHWLQDNCSCCLCVHPSTREPIVHFANKNFLGIASVSFDINGLLVVWKDGHKSEYNNGWLRSHSFELQDLSISQAQNALILWDSSSLQISNFQYSETNKPQVMYDALSDLRRYGVVIFKNTPREDKEVIRFAEKIGTIKETVFGRYFDVVAEVDPNSNGYTSFELLPHIDIAYYEVPPAYQMLHFLHNDAKGGMSTLVDGFKLSMAIKEDEPEVFDLLTKPIYTFRFQDEQCEHSYRGPIIELDQQGNVKSVRMDSDTLEPLVGPLDDVKKARNALETFFRYSIDVRYKYECKLEAGDLMMIANTRLLHGRSAFEAQTGKRQLQVCYLDRGEIMSYMQVLKRDMNQSDGDVFDDAGNFLMNTST